MYPQHPQYPPYQDAYGHGPYKYHPNVTVSLRREEVWQCFLAQTTEMIVSRPGRKLFPKIAVDIQGLQPDLDYKISLHFIRSDPYKWRYDGQWTPVGEEEEVEGASGKIIHFHSGKKGMDWMSDGAEFDDFILTNNPEFNKGNSVFLQSQHAYVPHVVIEQVTTNNCGTYRLHAVQCAPLFSCRFIAVTAYQNDEIKKLKVTHNPFARGSRSVHNNVEPRKRAKEEADDEVDVKRARETPPQDLPPPPPVLPPLHHPQPHYQPFPITHHPVHGHGYYPMHSVLMPYPHNLHQSNIPKPELTLPPFNPFPNSSSLHYNHIPDHREYPKIEAPPTPLDPSPIPSHSPPHPTHNSDSVSLAPPNVVPNPSPSPLPSHYHHFPAPNLEPPLTSHGSSPVSSPSPLLLTDQLIPEEETRPKPEPTLASLNSSLDEDEEEQPPQKPPSAFQPYNLTNDDPFDAYLHRDSGHAFNAFPVDIDDPFHDLRGPPAPDPFSEWLNI